MCLTQLALNTYPDRFYGFVFVCVDCRKYVGNDRFILSTHCAEHRRVMHLIKVESEIYTSYGGVINTYY